MEGKVYSVEGKETHTVNLPDSIFSVCLNEGLIWYAVNNELANKRMGTASTKDRGEVHGSNAKPYKQKGTGRARRGDKKSPLMVGGGVVFGPRPKDYSYSIPKKAKRAAIKTVLSLKVKSDLVHIVEDFSLESGKTKELKKVIDNFVNNERTIFILSNEAQLLRRAGKNIPFLNFLSFDRLNIHDLFYARKVVIFESTIAKLDEFYNGIKG